LCENSTNFLIFDATGVRLFPIGTSHYLNIDVSLHDSTPTYFSPNDAIMEKSRLVVQATSTKLSRYKDWTQQREGSCFYVVEPWTWEEMEMAEYLPCSQYFVSVLSFVDDSRLRAKYAPDKREGTLEGMKPYLTTKEAFEFLGPFS
jgi:hypothetical protein